MIFNQQRETLADSEIERFMTRDSHRKGDRPAMASYQPAYASTAAVLADLDRNAVPLRSAADR